MPTHIVTPHHKPAKQARGRRIVLLLVGFLVAGQGLAGYVIDHHGLAVRFSAAATVLLEMEDAPPPHIVWLGSSRSEGGIRPDVMNLGLWQKFGRHRVNFFNAAVPAGDPATSQFLLDALLERGHRPEVLVVEVPPDMLSRKSLWFGMHAIRQTNWADVPAFIPEATRSGNLARLVMARLIPLYAHRKQIRDLALPTRQGETPPLGSPRCWAKGYFRWGHFEDYPEPPASPDLERKRIDFDSTAVSPQLRDYRTDGIVSAALGRLLSRCDAEGISVVLVLPAVSATLRDLYTPEVERRFQDELSRMREKHPFEVVDLRDSVLDAGFVDIYHLEPGSGGLVYSRAALDRVVLPAVERRGLGASR